MQKKSKEIKEGKIEEKDYIVPAYINETNPKYIEIDGIFYGGIICTDYYREYNEIILKNKKFFPFPFFIADFFKHTIYDS